MRKARFSEEQTTYALKQVESGKSVGKSAGRSGSESSRSTAGRRSTKG